MKRLLFGTLLIFCLSTFAANHSEKSKGDHSAHAAKAGERNITIVNYEIKGVKQWNPGTIIVKQGETVNLTLKNTAGAVHGFSISAYNIKENVKKDGTNKVSFKASKKGLFDITCHLHPAHVGGQLLVQ